MIKIGANFVDIVYKFRAPMFAYRWLEANNNVEERTTLNTLEIVGHIFAGLIKLTQEIQGPC